MTITGVFLRKPYYHQPILSRIHRSKIRRSHEVLSASSRINSNLRKQIHLQLCDRTAFAALPVGESTATPTAPRRMPDAREFPLLGWSFKRSEEFLERESSILSPDRILWPGPPGGEESAKKAELRPQFCGSEKGFRSLPPSVPTGFPMGAAVFEGRL